MFNVGRLLVEFETEPIANSVKGELQRVNLCWVFMNT
jgi:hypothetical protein